MYDNPHHQDFDPKNHYFWSLSQKNVSSGGPPAGGRGHLESVNIPPESRYTDGVKMWWKCCKTLILFHLYIVFIDWVFKIMKNIWNSLRGASARDKPKSYKTPKICLTLFPKIQLKMKWNSEHQQRAKQACRHSQKQPTERAINPFGHILPAVTFAVRSLYCCCNLLYLLLCC